MNIGQMDRQIILQQNVLSRATNGEELHTWQDVATVYAEKKTDAGAEVYQADQKTAVQKVKFRIRYRSDITTQMRLLEVRTGEIYQVDAIAEIGRKQGHTLSCYSRGEEPTV